MSPIDRLLRDRVRLRARRTAAHFEQAIFREPGDTMRFTYSADHPLAGEFEEQMIRLIRESKGDGEYLSVHHPAEPDAKDDAPDSTALAFLGAATGGIGSILML